MKIAFLGMGIMGSAMAANCLRAGHQLTVYNRTPAKCEPLRQAGAWVAPTPAEAARGQEAVLLCVEDTPDVEAVLFGEHGVTHGLPDPSLSGTEPPVLVIDHSTVSAAATEGFARRIESERRALYLDVPVTGGDVGAREGTLAFMCGGSAEAFARARPLLEAMGKVIVHIGPRHGDGQRAKMINQLIVAINCMATTEGLRLGEAMGLDLDKVMAAISQGAAGSWSLSNLGPRWLRRDFKPGFRLRHLLKDLRFCQEAIESASGPANFPAAELALELVQKSVQADSGDLNIHAMAKIFFGKGR